MRHDDLRPQTTRGRHGWAVLVAVALVGLTGVVSGEPAVADVPPVPIAAPFDAPLCENTTGDPSVDADGGPVTNLRSVFGQRLVDYNAGQPVILYNNSGRSGWPAGGQYTDNPVCVVRYVDDAAGPVSSWTYCTYDRASSCSWTNAAGQLERNGVVRSGLVLTNPDVRLTADQQKLQAYIIQTDLPVVAGPNGNGGTVPVDTLANNASQSSRVLRQNLVHCIDNPTRASALVFCANNMSPTTQARILELIGPDAADQLAANGPAASVQPGDDGSIEVTTTLAGMPLTLTATGGTVTLCGGPATLTGSTLVVDASAAVPAVITLCATRPTPGSVSVTVTAQPPVIDNVGFSQSNPASTLCQIFSTYQLELRQTVTASAAAAFAVPAMGTTLVDQGDGDHYLAQAGGTVVDTVAYTGLQPSTAYTVEGELMVQATGNPTGIVGSTSFTSSPTGAGTIDVTFVVSGAWAGSVLTAFESIALAGTQVASHEDLNDAAQTVWIADVDTTLLDLADSDKVLPAIGGTAIDTVAYEHLAPTTTYTVSGELYDTATGSATGIVGSTTFVSSATGNGDVDVQFAIPSGYAGRSLVAFEEIAQGATVVATHADIAAASQTVRLLSAPAPASPAASSPLAHTGSTVPIGPGMLAMSLIAAGIVLVWTVRRTAR